VGGGGDEKEIKWERNQLAVLERIRISCSYNGFPERERGERLAWGIVTKEERRGGRLSAAGFSLRGLFGERRQKRKYVGE